MIDILLTSTELSQDACLTAVLDDSTGGVVVFTGTVRNETSGKKVLRLEFEAYEPMAEKEMRKIGEHVIQAYDALHISIHHRTGVLEIGDVPVIIAVSAPHRKAAFDACAYAIDTLKETVPIWKKEVFEDGDVWVAAHP